VLGCLYLFSSLPLTAVVVFFSWNAVGLVAYLLYGRLGSRLAKG
jgi:APA family basic amino acid/polyamine antiporter